MASAPLIISLVLRLNYKPRRSLEMLSRRLGFTIRQRRKTSAAHLDVTVTHDATHIDIRRPMFSGITKDNPCIRMPEPVLHY